MRSHGRAEPTELQKWLDKVRFSLQRWLSRDISVDDGEYRYTFRCSTTMETWRAMTLFIKEEGTVRFITGEARPGDIFYDIGANIGPYTLMAAKRVRPNGAVYAFEPHASNFQSLIENIRLNGLGDVVKAMSSALNNQEGFFDFNYYMLDAGTSMSQLADRRDDHDREFRPVFTERKHGTTIDRLIEDGVIERPNLIKMDVDGNELLILKGMRTLLEEAPPRAILMEVNARHKTELYDFMSRCGFEEVDRQYARSGEKAIAAGVDPSSLNYNGLFKRRGLQRK
jgi:FkbM family methyltransferase